MTVYETPGELIASDDIDLVVVATPNDTHAQLARAAISAGKHVVVDKPFTVDLMEARDIVARAAASGRVLTVFHNRRWDSDYLTVKAAIASGRIGHVTHFESHLDRYRPAVRDRWRERKAAGAGVWFDLGPHLIDQALQLFGLPDTVLASVATQRIEALVEDWAHVVLHYGEQRVVLHTAMLVAGGSNRFTVHGPQGSLVKHAADQQEAQLLAGILPGHPMWGRDDDPLQVHDGNGRKASIQATPGDQRRFYSQLANAIIAGGANPVRPIEGLAVMAVLDASFRSAREGIAVPLGLTQAETAQW
jgi:predicted dehydrogenase